MVKKQFKTKSKRLALLPFLVLLTINSCRKAAPFSGCTYALWPPKCGRLKKDPFRGLAFRYLGGAQWCRHRYYFLNRALPIKSLFAFHGNNTHLTRQPLFHFTFNLKKLFKNKIIHFRLSQDLWSIPLTFHSFLIDADCTSCRSPPSRSPGP